MSVINMWINRYILAGRGSVADTAPTNEVVVDANGALSVAVTGSNLILPVHDSAPNGYNAPTDSIKTAVGRGPTTVYVVTSASTLWPLDMYEWKHLRLDIVVIGTTPSAVVKVLSAPRPSGTYLQETDANANKTVTATISYLVKDVARFVEIDVSAVTGTSPYYEIHVTPFN